MIVSGSGTRDSPIAIDDDSEGEVITELFRCPITYLEDSESTPLLSPRRGTFLSAVPPLHLSATSAQSLKKYREGTVLSLITGYRVSDFLSPFFSLGRSATTGSESKTQENTYSARIS